MPVIQYVPQDPTDTVLQGEQLRIAAFDARPNYPGNVIFGPIMSRDVSGLDSIVQDEDAFLPMNAFVEVSRLSIRQSKDGGFRVRANGGIATPCGEWVPLDTSPLLLTAKPGSFSFYRLTGVSRDSTGAVLGGCTVKVFMTLNDTKVYETVSDGSGNWSIDVSPNPGPFYYVEYLIGSPDRAGTSINTNVPTVT